MNNFVEFKVEKEPYISIGWHLGNICNYSCSYCMVKYPHYVKHQFPKDDIEFINFIKKVQTKYPNKKILVSMFGGEPTIWKSFKSVIKKLKQHNVNIRLITNGSQPIEWWSDVLDYIDYLIVSYHTEYHNKKHIIELMSMVSQNKNLQSQINFMLKPDNFYKEIEVAKEISMKSKCFILLKLLRKVHSTELFDYTDDKLNYLENNRIIGEEYFNNNEYEFEIYSICKDNSIVKHKNVNEVIIHKINRWKGWECTAGIDSFAVDYKQDIYVCNQIVHKKGKIGNLSGDYELPNKPFICEAEACTCLQDILDCNKRKI